MRGGTPSELVEAIFTPRHTLTALPFSRSGLTGGAGSDMLGGKVLEHMARGIDMSEVIGLSEIKVNQEGDNRLWTATEMLKTVIRDLSPDVDALVITVDKSDKGFKMNWRVSGLTRMEMVAALETMKNDILNG